MQPTQTEERLFRFLSKVGQKCYDYLGFGTISTSLLLNILSTIFLTFLMLMYLVGHSMDLYKIMAFVMQQILYTSSALVLIVALYYCLGLISGDKNQLIANTNKQPNPNKYTSWIFHTRIMFPCIFFGFLVSPPYVGLVGSLIAALFFIPVIIGMYTFCIDKPIPKPKKETKKILSVALEGQ